jgi:excisionase family DNA binding protein
MTPEPKANVMANGLARIPEAMAYLQISRTALYGLMDNGQLSYVKIGKSRRIPWAELIRLVERHTVPAHGQTDGTPR